jgi:hypothetical protein
MTPTFNRALPFPETPERARIPESVVWDRLGQKYRARFVNEPRRIYDEEVGEGSLGFLRSAVHYVRFSFQAGISMAEQRRTLSSSGAKALWLCGLPVGWAAYAIDRMRRAQTR